MFISEEIEDLIDEIECFPESWHSSHYNFWHKEKPISFWIANGFLSFGEERSGLRLNFFEKIAVWKAVKSAIKFRLINGIK